jgi:hypothetical protein
LRRPNDTREELLISLAQVSVPLLLGAQTLIRNLTPLPETTALQVQQPWESYDPLIAFFASLNRLYYCGFLLRLGLLNGYDFPASGVPSDLSWFLWGTLRGHV